MELFIGIVAPAAVDYMPAIDHMAKRLEKLGFEVNRIKLSALIDSFRSPEKRSGGFEDQRILSLMDGGDRLRTALKDGAALAKVAVLKVAEYRKDTFNSESVPDGRNVAHLFLSLKHPKEMAFLRATYGDAFVAISFYQPRERRVDALATRIARSRESSDLNRFRSSAEEIINRDEQAGARFGQQVADVFAESDFFANMTNKSAGLSAVDRFVDILFGHPFVTPTIDEYGMFLAWGVSLRSADLSRQVGAAICDDEGNLIAVGCNDVPKAGGGQYWPGEHDARDFQRGYDSSALEKRFLITEVMARLKTHGWLSADKVALSPKQQMQELMGPSDNEPLLKGVGINNLLEFGRIVHAEMAAIADAARRGIQVRNSTLYSTTFPCHVCARHIVAAGVKRVVYIEPYPKSRAKDLHDDSLVVDSPNLVAGKVTLQAFAGMSPRRYGSMFSMVKRKDGSGIAVRGEAALNQHRLKPIPLYYLSEELSASAALKEALAGLQPESDDAAASEGS